jgi:hypothetical protein
LITLILMSFDTCPHCGADLPRGARACPECGSDEKTGWSAEAEADPLGLDEERFDYDEFVAREFGKPSIRPRGIAWYWWLTGLVLVGILLSWWLRH